MAYERSEHGAGKKAYGSKSDVLHHLYDVLGSDVLMELLERSDHI
jgi:hypothetical protein